MSALLKPAPAAVDITSARAAGAALRTFFRLAEAWGLTGSEQATLLGVARATLSPPTQCRPGQAKRRSGNCYVGLVCKYGFLSRMMALRTVNSFLATAMRASLAGLPACRSRA